MTRRRPEAFSLAEAARSPSFTPRAADVPGLVDLLAADDPKLARAATRALGRVPGVALEEARRRLSDARPPLRGRIAALLVGLAKGGDEPVGTIAPLLGDPDPKTRRQAVIALGKVRTPESERALLAYLSSDGARAHREVVVEALGKVGGRAALEALRGEGAADRARITLERSLEREIPSRIDPAASLAGAPIALHCRHGLERILAAELPAAMRARVVARGRVEGALAGPLAEVFRARTWTGVGFPLPRSAGPPAEAIVQMLLSREATRVFGAWTRGPIRFRLAFAGGGHKRAIVWAVAEGLRRARSPVVNDPTDSPWEAQVAMREGGVVVELVPRLEDTRFAYRKRDVPAASHPTLAAALVRVAGRDPDAVVWDPFCGSGLELCERAIAGPARALHGSDADPRALEAARENLAAAGAANVTLTKADALSHVVPGATLVLTNPPYGARSAFGQARRLLPPFVDRIARLLPAGGRFVWVSPLPQETREAAERAGLEPTFRESLDDEKEIQAFWKQRG